MNTTEEQQGCVAMGLIVREGNEVRVAMEWHMAHSLSEDYQRQFLWLRCRALQAAFGDGVMVQAKGCLPVDFLPYGVAISGSGPKMVSWSKDRPCTATMGFLLPVVDSSCWESMKKQFKDVFEPAALHGGVSCHEGNEMVYISSQFALAEKGGD